MLWLHLLRTASRLGGSRKMVSWVVTPNKTIAHLPSFSVLFSTIWSQFMKDYTIRIVLMGTLEGCETRSYYRELSLISVSVSSPIIRPMEGLITSKQLCNYWPVKVMTIFKVWNDIFFPLGKSFLPADAVERTFHPKCLYWFGTAWDKFS